MEQKEKELLEEDTSAGESADRPGGAKVGAAVFLAVILIFAGIMVVTGLLGSTFGRTVENIALGVIAVILLVLLIKSKRS